jgi:hypothetical protein
LDAYDPELDYGYAEFDVRHRLSASFIWALPFGRDATGAAGAILDGWQIQGIYAAQSGTPFTMFDCTNGVSFCMRMLEVGTVDRSGSGDPKPVPGEPNRWEYIDLRSQLPAVGSYANPLTGSSDFGPYPANMTERNAFRGPGRWNVDAAITKSFRFVDDQEVQFRAEVYNVFNHANLYLIGSETFIDSMDQETAYVAVNRGLDPKGKDQRRWQFAVRYIF